MNLEQRNKKELISMVSSLMVDKEALIKEVELLKKRVVELEAKASILELKKDSSNSSIPPSADQNRVSKNKSLRKVTGRKKGGQVGHKGCTLEINSTPDKVIKHTPSYCHGCGSDLDGISAVMKERRQVIDIPPIYPICTEHQVFEKTCNCGHTTKGTFPNQIKAPVQYGAMIKSMASYFSVRQYMPYQRMKECFSDLFNVSICESTLVNAVSQMARKSLPIYQRIKQNIETSKVIGADETGAKINGDKCWFWTWQTPTNTLIFTSLSRGYDTIERVFPNGLPNSTLISDCLAAQLKTPAKNHQICTAHLLRELNYFIELYDDPWSKSFRQLLQKALLLNKKIDYQQAENKTREHLENRLGELLILPINKLPKKVKPFYKRMCKIKDYLFPFLYDEHIPPDNNASERAIRNIKVKLKVSGQFINIQNAMNFAVIRSVIDTAIKNEANIIESLKLIASFSPE